VPDFIVNRQKIWGTTRGPFTQLGGQCPLPPCRAATGVEALNRSLRLCGWRGLPCTINRSGQSSLSSVVNSDQLSFSKI